MLKKFKRVLALVMISCFVLTCFSTGFNAAAISSEDTQAIRDEINRLNQQSQALQHQINDKQNQLQDKNAIKNTIESQIYNTQQKIDACNRYIQQCQAEIAESEAKIADSNKKIEDTKERFKKRIRSLYNSNTGSGIQVLLGAESFSDFLALTELTQCVSAQDNKLIDEIISSISEIQSEIEKSKQLKAQQDEIKQTLALDMAALDSQVASVNSVISEINSSKSDLQAEQNRLKKQMQEYENSLLYGGVSDVAFDGMFRWPVPGYPMTCPFMSNDSVHRGNHNGIDLGSYGIVGKPILAAATGKVTKYYNSCPHNYGKNGSCGCGGGYGNHIQISHGNHGGYYYLTIYAHMRTAAVSPGQHVSRGQVVGYVGSTGWSTGFHLHFGIARGVSEGNMRWQNPMNYSYINR